MANEFAQALDQILTKHGLQVSRVAEEADITQGYLSNLRRRDYKPSAKTLRGLIKAFRASDVPNDLLQRLIKASGHNPALIDAPSNSLSGSGELSLIHDFLQKPFRIDQERWKISLKNAELGSPLSKGFSESRNKILKEARELLKNEFEKDPKKGKAYITWLHTPLIPIHRAKEEAEEEFVDTLRELLNTEWEVRHICSNHMKQITSLIENVQKDFLGTENYYLFEVSPFEAPIAEYIAVADGPALIILPTADGYISSEISSATPVTKYLDYVLGSRSHSKLVMHTYRVDNSYSVDELTELVDAARNASDKQRWLFKTFFSDAYVPVDIWCNEVKSSGQSDEEVIEEHRKLQQERRQLLRERLQSESGKEWCIYNKSGLQFMFSLIAEGFTNPKDVFQKARANSEQGKLIFVLKQLKEHPENFVLGLRDDGNLQEELPDDSAPQEELARVAITGNRALFERRVQPRDQSPKSCYVWVYHPKSIKDIRTEFEKMWKEIHENWHTDNTKGRQHVTQWLVAEMLKAIMKASSSPYQGSFVNEIITSASMKKAEFFTETSMIEGGESHSHVLLVNSELPLHTMNLEDNSFDEIFKDIFEENQVFKRAIRIRSQFINYYMINGDFHYNLIMSESGIFRYLQNKIYGLEGHKISPDKVIKHFEKFIKLLEKLKDHKKFTIQIVRNEPFPLNFEVVDKKIIFLEAGVSGNIGYIIIENEELAQMFIQFTEKLIQKSSLQLEGVCGVIDWLTKELDKNR